MVLRPESDFFADCACFSLCHHFTHEISLIFNVFRFSSQSGIPLLVRFLVTPLSTMSGYAENWASTPWAPEPLEAVQHLRSLLCATSEEQRDQNVPRKILDSIEEKIKAHCKYKHLVPWYMWNTNVTPPQDETSSACGSASPLITTRILVTLHITVLNGNITIGRRLRSTFGSKRHGVPLHHGR